MLTVTGLGLINPFYSMKGYEKKKIPKALREQLWIQKVGKKFQTKCKTTWCSNIITTFDFQCGHDIPESKGGNTDITNLVPICARCNLSMGNQYTFNEWCKVHKTTSKWKHWIKKVILAWTSYDTKENGSKSTQNHMNQKGKLTMLHGAKSKTLPLTLKEHTGNTLQNTEKM